MKMENPQTDEMEVDSTKESIDDDLYNLLYLYTNKLIQHYIS